MTGTKTPETILDFCKWTRVSIESPSSLFDNDLWIKRGGPLKAVVAYELASNALTWQIVLELLTYAIAGCISSLVLMPISRFKREFWKGIVLGLANIFNIIVVIIFGLIMAGPFDVKIGRLIIFILIFPIVVLLPLFLGFELLLPMILN